MRVEGYILRYSTSERNISFRLAAPNNTSGQQLLEHLANELNINPRSLRGFYISKARIAGEFENLREYGVTQRALFGTAATHFAHGTESALLCPDL